MDSGRNRGTRIERQEGDSYMGQIQGNMDGDRTMENGKGQRDRRGTEKGIEDRYRYRYEMKDKEKGRWTGTD